MASSSKQRRGSSSKQSSAKANVISVKRKGALPRKANLSTDLPSANRTKTTRAAGRASGKLNKPAAMVIAPVVEPVVVTALVPVPETVGAVEPARMADEVSAMAPPQAPEVEALAIIETEVEASAILEETTIVEAPFALPVEAVTFPSTEIAQLPVSEETREAPLARTAAASPAPAAPAPHHGKRALVTIVSQLLSALLRWTGIR